MNIFLCMLVFSINIFGINLIVKPDGTGDATTIQDAIFEAGSYPNENSIIVVYPGIYGSTYIVNDNENHTLLIQGTNKATCIIDGNHINNSLSVNIMNSTTVTLKNFTIINGENSGIVIGSYEDYTDEISPSEGNFIIDNCTIANNGYFTNLNLLEPGKHGAGIRCYGNLVLKNSDLGNNRANYDDYPKERLGGGVYINNSENYVCTITNCTFKKNISGGGGAIYATGAGDVNVVNNTFDKDSLYVDFFIGNENGIACLFDNCTANVNVKHNIFKDHFYYDNDDTIGLPIIVFNNCPNANFSNNDIINFPIVTNFTCGLSFFNSDNIVVENNIFKSLYFNIYGQGTYTVDYNYLPTCNNGLNSNVDLGEHNILYLSSQLDYDTFCPIWNADVKSPLIDSGDPNFPADQDGSQADIGAKASTIMHDNFVTKLYPNRVRWISFPVLDRNIWEYGTEPIHVFARVGDFTQYFNLQDPSSPQFTTTLEGEIWQSSIDSLYSKKGYIAKTESYTEINVSGTKLPDNTLVSLHEGVNYVGYFIKESMTIENAFSDIWDNLEEIESEDWAWVKNGNYPANRCVLVYGKMYRIVVNSDCEFQYLKTNPVPPKEREMTNGFSYQETASYVPINIENLDDPNITEIGVFANGECIGASKVEELPIQILAYPKESKANQSIGFEYYYGTKSYKKIDNYIVVKGNNIDKIELTPFKMQTVKFTSKFNSTPILTIGNYPNPFKPSGSSRGSGTTISFNIPKESNVDLAIYNIKGQKVKSLVSGNTKAGEHRIVWKGLDSYNNTVSSGIYFYKLSFENQSKVGKMILLK